MDDFKVLVIEHDRAWRTTVEECLGLLEDERLLTRFSSCDPDGYADVDMLVDFVQGQRADLVITNEVVAARLNNARIARQLKVDSWVFLDGQPTGVLGIDMTQFRATLHRADVDRDGLLALLRGFVSRRHCQVMVDQEVEPCAS